MNSSHEMSYQIALYEKLDPWPSSNGSAMSRLAQVGGYARRAGGV